MEENLPFFLIFLGVIAVGVIHIIFPSFVNELRDLTNMRWRLREHPDWLIRLEGILIIVTAVIIGIVLIIPK